MTSTANSDHSGSSWMAPSSSQLSWELSSTPTQAQKSPPAIQRAQSPNPASQLSNTKDARLDAVTWGVEMGGNLSTPSFAVSSPAAMTKEEKALEMTRRKEERKQVCFQQK